MAKDAPREWFGGRTIRRHRLLPAYVNQLPEAEGSQAYHRVGDSVRVEMIKGGVITGNVVNANGESN